MSGYGLFQATAALDEFRTLPYYKTALRRVAKTYMDGATAVELRHEVSRLRGAFLEYRCDLTICGETW